jgi:putative membrane protein
VWDAQWDMLLALLGATAALLLGSRWHDRSMERVPRRRGEGTGSAQRAA